MSGYSNVGNRGVYEAGDQRNPPQSEIPQRDRFEEGKEHSHQALDSSKISHMRKEESNVANIIIRG